MSFLKVTGGGGYTKENVARCWTVETGVLLDTELPNGTIQNNWKLMSYFYSPPVGYLSHENF